MTKKHDHSKVSEGAGGGSSPSAKARLRLLAFGSIASGTALTLAGWSAAAHGNRSSHRTAELRWSADDLAPSGREAAAEAPSTKRALSYLAAGDEPGARAVLEGAGDVDAVLAAYRVAVSDVRALGGDRPADVAGELKALAAGARAFYDKAVAGTAADTQARARALAEVLDGALAGAPSSGDDRR